MADDKGEEMRNTPEGKLRGRSLDVSKGPVAFDAHSLHCTLPWSGSRVVLIGFCPDKLDNLPAGDVDYLLELGFTRTYSIAS